MATSDLIDEVVLANYLAKQRSGRGFLDNKVLIGSMNRGGLSGTAFEMDDAFTGMSGDRLAKLRRPGCASFPASGVPGVQRDAPTAQRSCHGHPPDSPSLPPILRRRRRRTQSTRPWARASASGLGKIAASSLTPGLRRGRVSGWNVVPSMRKQSEQQHD